jgi:hypothetical protein
MQSIGCDCECCDITVCIGPFDARDCITLKPLHQQERARTRKATAGVFIYLSHAVEHY